MGGETLIVRARDIVLRENVIVGGRLKVNRQGFVMRTRLIVLRN